MRYTVDEAEHFDKILSFLIKYSGSWIGGDMIHQQVFPGMPTQELYKLLEKLEVINSEFPVPVLRMQDGGDSLMMLNQTRLFLAKGGFTAKLAAELKEAEQKQEVDRLQHEKLKIDIKNAKRIHKTYWYTFGFSVTAFIISVVLLFIKLKEIGFIKW